MRTGRRGACGGLALVLATAGCGAPGGPDSLRVGVSVPWSAAALSSCAQPEALAGVQAVLKIGGQRDCPLSVDPESLTASGGCEQIVVGVVRPLMLVYSLPVVDETAPATLAVAVGYVDLRPEALADDSERVSVVLGADAGGFVVDASGAAVLAEDTAATLTGEANRWAAEVIAAEGMSLDDDGDGRGNLLEVCDGTPVR